MIWKVLRIGTEHWHNPTRIRLDTQPPDVSKIVGRVVKNMCSMVSAAGAYKDVVYEACGSNDAAEAPLFPLLLLPQKHVFNRNAPKCASHPGASQTTYCPIPNFCRKISIR